MLKKIFRKAAFEFREHFGARPSGAGLGGLHFVEDYERLVRNLMASHPLDEAMSLAVGGDYEAVGATLRDIVRHAGLRNGMTLVDLGCGSGRLEHALGKEFQIECLGTDIVEALLAYARTKSPANYRFVRHADLSIPAPDASADMACAFSVFTHLLHEETYLYLADIHRVLKPGGTLVFSFLEFAAPQHWSMFEHTVASRHGGTVTHLNTFIERSAINVWARRLNYRDVQFIGGGDTPWRGAPLWQSVAILRRA